MPNGIVPTAKDVAVAGGCGERSLRQCQGIPANGVVRGVNIAILPHNRLVPHRGAVPSDVRQRHIACLCGAALQGNGTFGRVIMNHGYRSPDIGVAADIGQILFCGVIAEGVLVGFPVGIPNIKTIRVLIPSDHRILVLMEVKTGERSTVCIDRCCILHFRFLCCSANSRNFFVQAVRKFLCHLLEFRLEAAASHIGAASIALGVPIIKDISVGHSFCGVKGNHIGTTDIEGRRGGGIVVQRISASTIAAHIAVGQSYASFTNETGPVAAITRFHCIAVCLCSSTIFMGVNFGVGDIGLSRADIKPNPRTTVSIGSYSRILYLCRVFVLVIFRDV